MRRKVIQFAENDLPFTVQIGHKPQSITKKMHTFKRRFKLVDFLNQIISSLMGLFEMSIKKDIIQFYFFAVLR